MKIKIPDNPIRGCVRAARADRSAGVRPRPWREPLFPAEADHAEECRETATGLELPQTNYFSMLGTRTDISNGSINRMCRGSLKKRVPKQSRHFLSNVGLFRGQTRHE